MKFENLEVAAELHSELTRLDTQIGILDSAIDDERHVDFRVHPIQEADEWLNLDTIGIGDACAKAVRKVLVNRKNAIKREVAKL